MPRVCTRTNQAGQLHQLPLPLLLSPPPPPPPPPLPPEPTLSLPPPSAVTAAAAEDDRQEIRPAMYRARARLSTQADVRWHQLGALVGYGLHDYIGSITRRSLWVWQGLLSHFVAPKTSHPLAADSLCRSEENEAQLYLLKRATAAAELRSATTDRSC